MSIEEQDTMIRRTCQRKSCLLRRHKAGIIDGAFLFGYAWIEGGILIDVNCPNCGAVHCVELRKPISHIPQTFYKGKPINEMTPQEIEDMVAVLIARQKYILDEKLCLKQEETDGGDPDNRKA